MDARAEHEHDGGVNEPGRLNRTAVDLVPPSTSFAAQI
jgi:hypothetical protein